MADGKFIEVSLEVSQIEFMKMENGYAIYVKRNIFDLRWVKKKLRNIPGRMSEFYKCK